MVDSCEPKPSTLNSKPARQFPSDTHEEVERVSVCPVRNSRATEKSRHVLGFCDEETKTSQMHQRPFMWKLGFLL